EIALRVHPGHRLADDVLARRGHPPPRGCAVETYWIEPVAPDLQADGALDVPLEEMPQTPIGEPSAPGGAALGLLELIAVDGIVEEVGEIREEIQAVSNDERGAAQ